jgi:hypothetical protein
MAVLRVRKPASGNTLSFARANRVITGLLVAAAAALLHDNVRRSAHPPARPKLARMRSNI